MSKAVIQIINGPNLNLLTRRAKSIYGSGSLDDAEKTCRGLAEQLEIELIFKQSNSESEIISWIQESLDNCQGIIINAAGYTHSSVAIRDALEMFNRPKIELHISNVFKREQFRRHSLISEVVDAVICGLGIEGYGIALLAIHKLISKNNFSFSSDYSSYH